jgi:hypothetical protein
MRRCRIVPADAPFMELIMPSPLGPCTMMKTTSISCVRAASGTRKQRQGFGAA